MFWACARRYRVALATVLLVATGGCGEQTSPEQQVRELVSALATAVEAGSIRDAAELIDTDYQDRHHRSKREAVATLFAYLRRHRQIHLFTLVRELELSDGQTAATAVVYVAMGGTPLTSVESVVSLKADLYRFDVRMTLRDQGWRVLSSQWRRADLSVL